MSSNLVSQCQKLRSQKPASTARKRRLLTPVLLAITYRVECAGIPDVPVKVCLANLYCLIVVTHENLQVYEV